ncbi:DeoR family transcriptional regulator of aga operon [Geodermatophilus bullaregiensis]|uniref:DeoR/GlpR family DNA-binding transcription regulator n=1 Tax=Geodermatophilus bullaregiensis TaxID=1564160 RepID=UPI0019584988|nr:DeoR/GlpR family DNA-binding transcription regulator [Geodermatophilus bullaregiensis]MBM7804422.1 DeoR family transcriptional regulator of aga operon [Geodermatophilus bullaregiensis]
MTAPRGQAVTGPRPGGGAAGRQAWILSTLCAVGFLSVTDLARQLAVSQMTIRRDLHTLRATGRVRLVHGGASLVPRELRRTAFPDGEDTEAQQRVAQHAAELVGSRDTVAIDAGATGLAIARALPASFTGCVITHSMPALAFLTRERAGRVVALGGEFLPSRAAFVGPTTEGAIAQLRTRTFFVSPPAVDSRGLYAQSPAEASVQRRLMDIADDVVLVGTHEAFETSATALVGPVDRVTAVVCDRRPPAGLAAALDRAGVALRVVGP